MNGTPSREVLESLVAATHVAPVNASDLDESGTAKLIALRSGPTRSARFAGRSHWLRAFANHHVTKVVTASPAPAETATPPQAEVILRLLRERRSSISPGPVPAPLVFSSMGVLGADREVRIDDAGRLWRSRGYPSAGGTHSIEPLLHAVDVSGLDSGWYCQAGIQRGDLVSVEFPGSQNLTAALDSALKTDVRPSAIIYAICDPALLSARYPGGSSLLWRDAGVFMMAAHSIAQSYGVTSTLVGICVEIDARTQIGPDAAIGTAFAVGAVAFGGRQGEEGP